MLAYGFRGMLVGVSGAVIQIIRPADNPVLARNEATGTDRDISELEGLDHLLGLVRPDVDMAAVKGCCSRRKKLDRAVAGR